MFNDYGDILSVKQLCEALNICQTVAYRLLKSGEIKSRKIGNIYKIPKKYLIEYVETLATSNKSDIIMVDDGRYSTTIIERKGAI